MIASLLFHVPLILTPIVSLPAPTAACQFDVLTPMAMEERVIAQFTTATAQYAALHRRLERSLPPEQMFDDPEDMFEARAALRTAILAARPMARQGNVFTPAVANVIRARLVAAMQARGHSAEQVLDAINEERLPGMPDPEVNHEYPWGIGSAMWPSLLHALPALPRELEYRFSDRDLVLIDVHANLVVDILDDALPAPAEAVS
jgi:hypothetical protein